MSLSRGACTVAAAFLPVSAFAAAEKKGMPQLDPANFASQLFWLAVFFVLFYVFMRFAALPRLDRIVKGRQARIADDLDHATTASGDSEMLKAELDAELAKARESARATIADITEKSRAHAAAEEHRASEAIALRLRAAEDNIAAARDQAMASVADIATGMVVDIVPRIGGPGISRDDARHMVAQKMAGG